MTKIYLMRHGFTENPDHLFYGAEFPLSERGKAQIAGLCEDMRVANVSPNIIAVSPFRRTQESAAVVADAFHLDKPRIDERLMEWNVGALLNRPLAEFYAVTKYDTPNWTIGPEIESHAHMAERVIEVIRECVTNFPNQEPLLVSHREPLVCAILALQDEPFSFVHELDLPVASIWELTFDGDQFISARKAFDRSADGHPHSIG